MIPDDLRQLLRDELKPLQRDLGDLQSQVGGLTKQVESAQEQVAGVARHLSELEERLPEAEVAKLRAGEQPNWGRLAAARMTPPLPGEGPKLAETEIAATTVLTRNQSGYRRAGE